MVTRFQIRQRHRLRAVERRSEELISLGCPLYGRAEGFRVLKMSPTYRANWMQLEARAGLIGSWPIYFLDQSDRVLIVFLDAADVTSTLNTAFNWGMAIQGAGGVLLGQIMAATTDEELDAIIDTRKWSDYDPGS